MKNGLLLFLFLSSLSTAQIKTEKHFYDEDMQSVDSSIAKFIYYNIYTNTIEGNGLVKSTTMDGKITSETEFSSIKKGIRNGFSKTYHDNGQLKSHAHYKDNEMDGELTSYYSSGQLKRRDYFKKGKFMNGQCFSSTGKDTIHFEFERMPQFPGGDLERIKFINANVKYVFEAKENGIEGMVVSQFKIDKEGRLIDIKIVRSVHPLLDNEVIRVLKRMPKWTPGIYEGEIVETPFTLPVRFKLD
jgi:protein TonB